MPWKYFNLRSPYGAHFGSPQWVINFPPWTECEHDLISPEPIGPGWNPKTLAFSADVPAADSSRPSATAKPDFPSVVGTWHAASRKMEAVLRQVAPDCLEFLPFRTSTSTGDDPTEAYSLMHYLHWASAVDSKASRLMPGETRLRRVAGREKDYLLDHVVFKRSKLTEPICKVVGWSPVHLYREDVAAALAEQGISGLEFEEIAVS